MKTCCPIFWPNGPQVDHTAAVLALADLVPAVGSTTVAHFQPHDGIQAADTLRLIWCPPVADLNGWCEQPSDLAFSHLLTARVIRPVVSAHPRHRAHLGTLEYALEILACERLLPALQTLGDAAPPWSLHPVGTPTGSHLMWSEVQACGRATVEGLTYLSATTPYETHLALILEITEQATVGLFSLHMHPGGTRYDLGRKRFTASELTAVNHALGLAHPLPDSQPPYLVAGPG